MGLFRHYRELERRTRLCNEYVRKYNHRNSMDAERIGTGKPLADYTSEELEAKVDKLQIILNTDIVDTYKAMGEYKKAEELEDEISMVKSMQEQNGAQK